ncbi:transcriptional regulator [Sphingomonas sp. TREG-RG-20F-R18-01]|uniref:3'-5' exonuclease n=1 Tax=Sphingomonas sp. TREG-RG-20F-R18-01 TaxID=2914982 RepID=UPI001F56B81A|nr:transcriptional regulator [Sphingomonas sp. TREG-RG-20F-R18-01]
MLVFIDFEASSLAKKSYPIEVGWVFEDGRSHGCLIRPAPDWTDWDPAAEAIHHIARDTLVADGTPHDVVATKMVADLSGHDLVASAPSWDGKWLSALLRAAGLDRRSLRLRASEDARRETATAILAPHVPAGALTDRVEDVLTLAQIREPAHVPAHRALADAQEERGRWCAVRTAALRAAERLQNDR